MSANTAIEWTDASWNPATGCTDVSPGCTNCYARTFAERWRGIAGHHFENGFDIQIRDDKLMLPLSWRKPRKVFVNSMSDLFHKDIPDAYIVQIFAVMAITPRHTYQVLTKRPGRMRSLLNQPMFWIRVGRQAREFAYNDSNAANILAGGRNIYDAGIWETVDHLPNVWLAVSAEDQHWANVRIPALLDTPAAVRWVSAEPLLGPIDLTRIAAHSRQQPDMVFDALGGRYGVPGAWQAKTSASLDWVVAGGESGHGARPAALDWFRDLRDQCDAASVPFLFKQHGQYRGFLTDDEQHRPADLYVNKTTGEALPEKDVPDTGSWSGVWSLGKKRSGRQLDGHEHNAFPAVTP